MPTGAEQPSCAHGEEEAPARAQGGRAGLIERSCARPARRPDTEPSRTRRRPAGSRRRARRSTRTSAAGSPLLQQFLELVEYYGTHPGPLDGAKPEEDLRAQAVAAVSRALALPAYHVPQAHELMERLQPPLAETRRRRSS